MSLVSNVADLAERVAEQFNGVFTGPTYTGDLDAAPFGYTSFVDTDVTHDPDIGPGLLLTMKNEDDSARVQVGYSIVGTYAIRYRLGGTWGAWLYFYAGHDAWTDITGKPSTFTPSTHSHAIADVTSLQATLDAKQGLDATLTALAGVTTTTDKLIYATGTDAFTTTDLSSTARTLLDDTSTSAMRTTLGLAIGSNVQAWDADLDTWATKTAPSGTAVGTSDTQTLTNKRVNLRIGTTASSSTPTPDCDSHDQYNVTALAANATFGAPTGTPVDGQRLRIRIKDNGTARTIAWNAIYISSGVATLLATTVISKTHLVDFVYDAAATKWIAVACDLVGY